MESKTSRQLVDDEAQAQVAIWEYAFGFTPMAVVRCAIEHRIADVLESHGGAMAHADLSAALRCSPPALHRVMRYLMHRGFFKQNKITSHQESAGQSEPYIQTPLSRMLIRNEENSMADFILMQSSPGILAPWLKLSSGALTNGASAFEVAHEGKDLWAYASANPEENKLINDAMACHAELSLSAILKQYLEAFAGIGSLVDVGGGDGTALRAVVKACPWIRGINFDLPHVVCVAPHTEGVEHVSGDMFEMVPKADAVFLMWILHDWSDEQCIVILSNCRKAIPKDTGKVMIAEAVIERGDEDGGYKDARLALDMVMLSHTEGKERSVEEWEYVVKAAGFSSYTVKHIQSFVSVIEAYP